jgi:hypothetical protein
MKSNREVHRVAIGRSRFLAWPGALLLACSPGFAGAAAPPASLVLAVGTTAQAGTGSVKGHLVWGDDKIPEIKVKVEQGKAPRDPEICAKDQPILSRELVVDPKSKGVASGFAYLVRPKGDFAATVKALLDRQPKVVLDQKNCEFQPYVLPFHKDQTLVIKSSDATNHNVRFSGFANPGINQLVAPRGELEVKLVADRVPLKLQCDIHNWMDGYLMVFDHPFFATTGPDGSFEIAGIPAGGQNLIVWHSTVGYVTTGGRMGMAIKIGSGEVTDTGPIKIDPAKAKTAAGKSN